MMTFMKNRVFLSYLLALPCLQEYLTPSRARKQKPYSKNGEIEIDRLCGADNKQAYFQS